MTGFLARLGSAVKPLVHLLRGRIVGSLLRHPLAALTTLSTLPPLAPDQACSFKLQS